MYIFLREHNIARCKKFKEVRNKADAIDTGTASQCNTNAYAAGSPFPIGELSDGYKRRRFDFLLPMMAT